MTESPIVELIRRIATALVDDVQSIEINEISGQAASVIELKVAKSDVGKLIGRQGRTADAIRMLMNCAASKLHKRYILEIIDQ